MTLKADIQALVDRFASDLESLVRKSAVEAVQNALGGSSPVKAIAPVWAPKRPGPKLKAVNVEKASAPKPASKKTTTRGTPRVRRSAEDIARLGQSIADYVKANPGSNAEKIKAGLKIPGNQWGLSIGWALDNKKVSRKGEKRAAVYSPAGAPAIARPAPVPPIKRAK